jgi:hypothetical protein
MHENAQTVPRNQQNDEEFDQSQDPHSPSRQKLGRTQQYEIRASSQILIGGSREVFSILGRGVQVIDVCPDSPVKVYRILSRLIVICHGVHQREA